MLHRRRTPFVCPSSILGHRCPPHPPPPPRYSVHCVFHPEMSATNSKFVLPGFQRRHSARSFCLPSNLPPSPFAWCTYEVQIWYVLFADPHILPLQLRGPARCALCRYSFFLFFFILSFNIHMCYTYVIISASCQRSATSMCVKLL